MKGGARANKRLFAHITNVLAKDKEISDRWRGFKDIADSRHMANSIEREVVNAQIPEAKVSAVAVGSRVDATATAWPGRTFEGEVIALLPQVDPTTRTLTARVALDNPGFALSPGMFVTLDFTGRRTEPQLVVPSEAVIETGERTVVIAARGSNGFDVIDVKTGAEQDGRTAILSGLTEGQSIVVSGQFLIDSEASLRSAVNRLGSASSGPRPERQP